VIVTDFSKECIFETSITGRQRHIGLVLDPNLRGERLATDRLKQ